MTFSMKNMKSERLSVLLKAGVHLTAERDLDRLLAKIVEETTVVLGADRSTLYLIDRKKQEMRAKIAQGVGAVEIRFPVGTGIAGYVGRTGEVVNTQDAYQDPRFNPAFDGMTGYRTRSMLCVPMKDINGDIIGAIQVLNKKNGLFTAEDETLLMALASQAAAAVDNAELYRKLSELNASLEEKVRERTAELVRANERLTALNRELEEVSITDGLTQAFNRQYFMDRLRQEVKRAHRYGTHVSLLMMDIDHFKLVNDTYGHQAGDAVLVGMTKLIKERLRETDLFCRYGGEEFALIAAAMDKADAMVLADRLRERVERAEFEYAGKLLKITLSIGVSGWSPGIREDFEELIRRADAALYRAKDEGRNRVYSD
jgi:diguanylate cyclase (GGDEF)-like protein